MNSPDLNLSNQSGLLLWEKQKSIGEMDRYKAKVTLEGVELELKVVLEVKRFKDFGTKKDREVINCRVEFSTEHSELSDPIKMTPLPILLRELSGVHDLIQKYFNEHKGSLTKLEPKFDFELFCKSGLKGELPRERRVGMGGTYSIYDFGKLREVVQAEISNAELKDPEIIDACRLLDRSESEQTESDFDIRGAIEALDPGDLTPETTARAITLHLLDCFSDDREILEHLLADHDSWSETGDTEFISSELLKTAFSDLLLQLDSALEKSGDKREAFKVVKGMLDSGNRVSIYQWFFLLRTLSHISDFIDIKAERLRDLEDRTLKLPLISQFAKTFSLEKVHLSDPYERAKNQWRKLEFLSPDGAHFVLSVIVHYGVMISQYSLEYPHNIVFRRILASFTEDGAKYRQTSDEDSGFEMTQIGRSWALPALYLGFLHREGLGDLFKDFLSALASTSVRGQVLGVRDMMQKETDARWAKQIQEKKPVKGQPPKGKGPAAKKEARKGKANS